MAEIIDFSNYLNNCGELPLIDVRSPSEFGQGHIPGAYNIPIFSDDERALIGTTYKQKGSYEAVLKGLDIVGPKMSGMVMRASEIAKNNQLVVHCWRGGMRSSSMSWLFETAGIKCFILKGGYKSYRAALKNYLRKQFHLLILGGMTGSGKSDILRELKKLGQQVIDLESLANHKGSAFGGLGRGVQPSTEQFENNLYEQMRVYDPDRIIWLEDESKKIGTIFIPDELFNQMRLAKVLKIEVSKQERIKKLVEEYSCFPKEKLIESLEKIKNRFGNQNLQPAVEAILNGNFERAASMILEYYDRAYNFGLEKRENGEVYKLPMNSIDPQNNAKAIIRFAKSL